MHNDIYLYIYRENLWDNKTGGSLYYRFNPHLSLRTDYHY